MKKTNPSKAKSRSSAIARNSEATKAQLPCPKKTLQPFINSLGGQLTAMYMATHGLNEAMNWLYEKTQESPRDLEDDVCETARAYLALRLAMDVFRKRLWTLTEGHGFENATPYEVGLVMTDNSFLHHHANDFIPA